MSRRAHLGVYRLNEFGNRDDAVVMRSFGYRGAAEVAALLPRLIHLSHAQYIFHGTHQLHTDAEEARLPRRRIGIDMS